MHKPFIPALLLTAALLTSCGGNAPAPTAARNSNAAAANNAQTSIQHGTSPSSNLGAAAAHGGGAAPPAADAAAERALVDTKELDARIKSAGEKARASNASAADKKAAADAYLARGNVYWSGGQPRLYKYALADFKQVLKYDPSNAEARQKIDTIVGIYQGMGRPVPEVPDEQ
ncbi:MAG: hypothetical protein JOZ02_23500 [Acidobacteria bacterium]|nr:hypothetical protein [Acidobacteriota bacterium]